jgi:DNA-binding protein H-NS
MDISNLNIKQLKDLIESAKSRISDLEKSGRVDARNKLLALARELGYEASDLISGSSSSAAPKVRRPAKPKYRNPADGTTWTGRGVRPKWVQAHLDSGKSLDSLLIK